MNRTALVLDGGGAQSVVLVRVLGALGWNVLCESGTRASRSRWTTAVVNLPPLEGQNADPAAYLERLRTICERWDVSVVAPSGDLRLAYCWQAAGENDTIVGARILSADRRSAEVFADKAAGIEAARRLRFPVPGTVLGESAEDIVDATASLGYPCVVKPRRTFQQIRGEMRQLRHISVGDRSQAQAAVDLLTGDDGLLPLAQEYVAGRALSVTAVIYHRVVVAYCARETFSFFPLGGGTSVWKRTISPGTPGVQEGLAFMRAWGLEGVAEVEYKLSSDGPRFMELGPRMHGWIPLAEASTPGFLAAAIHTALGDDVPVLPIYRSNVEMRWIGGEVRRIRSALDPRTATPRDISRLATLKMIWPPWRPGMLYDGIDLSDTGPWLPRPLTSWSARRKGSITRIAENDAPLTNRQNGPNVPSAG